MAFYSRSPRFFSHRRLTQLYSDTKRSYESAAGPLASGDIKVNPSISSSQPPRKSSLKPSSRSNSTGATGLTEAAETNPEVLALRRDFQMQQDRLLAWGYFWADVTTQNQRDASSPQTAKGDDDTAKFDLEIDRKIDQAGLGDLVASVMEEIKRLLDESGKLSHPDRYKKERERGASPKVALLGLDSGVKGDSKEQESEWQSYEVQTGRVLLEQLTACIDVLYSLVDSKDEVQEQEGQVTGVVSAKDDTEMKKRKSIDEPTPQQQQHIDTDEDLHAALMQGIYEHPLYIDFSRLQPMHDPNIDGNGDVAPPSYNDAQSLSKLQARSIYFFSEAQAHVVVDVVATDIQTVLQLSSAGPQGQLRKLHSFSEKLSGGGLLSWDGHLKMLGFTLAGSRENSRLGLVYALPVPSDPTALPQYQSLSATLAASADQDSHVPPLENKFALAYNTALLVVGYIAHGITHGQIRSSNLVFLRENDGQKVSSIRRPYLLLPIHNLLQSSNTSDATQGHRRRLQISTNDMIYSHPNATAISNTSNAAYDIYSLGLLLLEVGMWTPLRRFWKAKYAGARHLFADRLRNAYAPKLAAKCGSRYMKIVQKCLDAPDVLSEWRTKDGAAGDETMNAAEHLLSILVELRACCALDEHGVPSELDADVIEALIEEGRASLPKPTPEEEINAVEVPISLEVKEKNLPALPKELEAESLLQPRTKRRCKAGIRPCSKPALRKFPDLPIPQNHLNSWNNLLMPKLQSVLTSVLASSRESASVSLMMIGPTPEKATTTIVVQCSEAYTQSVHNELKNILRGKLRLGRGWGLVVVKGDVRRSARRLRASRPDESLRFTARRAKLDGIVQEDGDDDSRNVTQREFQKHPTSGASIGAFKNGQHLPPVSFGGVILVDGEPYGMTVHHMLDDASERDSDEEDSNGDDGEDNFDEPHRSSLNRESARSDFDSMGLHMQQDFSMSNDLELSDGEFDNDAEEYESESDTSTIRPDYSTFDEDGNECWFMEGSDTESLPDLDGFSSGGSEDDETASIGDRPAYDRYSSLADEDEELCVTQPALDDVDDDFFPCLEDRDDDHLCSHSLGFIHMSSGIRRVIKSNTKHEIDWALIKVDEERCSFTAAKRTLKMRSRVRTALKMPSHGPHLLGVTPMDDLPNTEVESIGRTSGPASGRISQAMSLVKFHGRSSFSSSYTVEGGFGRPGDSGAWIWNKDRSELCGHVLAWADGMKVAFMAPMEIMFEDMKNQLGAESIELISTVINREQDVKGKAKAKAEDKLRTDIDAADCSMRQTEKFNEQLERARELELALKRLNIDTASRAREASKSRDASQESRKGLNISVTGSRGSSAASGYIRSDGEEQRTRKERFDRHVSGGSEIAALPMARALS